MRRERSVRRPLNVDGEEGADGARLQKVLAKAGVASRRASEEMIREGRVAVDGCVVRELGARVRPDQVVTVDGKPIGREPLVYRMLNKPRGVVSTAADTHGRPTVVDVVGARERIYPVGRLDSDSEGLVLLTNDGELAFRLTHPRYHVEKEYHVLVRGRPSEEALHRLRRGIEIEGKMTAPARVDVIGSEGGDTWLRFVLHEGRKRQIRLMTESVGNPTLRLIRVRMGPLELGTLGAGQSRGLTADEVKALKDAAKL